MSITLREIRNYVKTYMYDKSPGTYMILDLHSKKKLGLDLSNALFRMPNRLFNLIKSVYNDEITANFIFKSMLVKPIAIKLGKIGYEEEVEKALLSGCESFIDYLKQNGVDSSLDRSICMPATQNSNAISSLP
ncbi:MAG: hypothetical protein F7B59_00010 [Desulfurococcales archaeon]|nr:hypothetical protein [Desulfurococcales archaeon]